MVAGWVNEIKHAAFHCSKHQPHATHIYAAQTHGLMGRSVYLRESMPGIGCLFQLTRKQTRTPCPMSRLHKLWRISSWSHRRRVRKHCIKLTSSCDQYIVQCLCICQLLCLCQCLYSTHRLCYTITIVCDCVHVTMCYWFTYVQEYSNACYVCMCINEWTTTETTTQHQEGATMIFSSRLQL